MAPFHSQGFSFLLLKQINRRLAEMLRVFFTLLSEFIRSLRQKNLTHFCSPLIEGEDNFFLLFLLKLGGVHRGISRISYYRSSLKMKNSEFSHVFLPVLVFSTEGNHIVTVLRTERVKFIFVEIVSLP
jgi:hypothetical protein